MTKLLLPEIQNPKHKEYIDRLNTGEKHADICKALCIASSTGYQIKRKYAGYINVVLPTDKTIDISRYDTEMIDYLKRINMRIGSILSTKDIQNSSITQLATTIGIVTEKIRLLEGKSTDNIAHKHIHEMSDKERSFLKDLAERYKKSMLK
jgi:hypothetical protein